MSRGAWSRDNKHHPDLAHRVYGSVIASRMGLAVLVFGVIVARLGGGQTASVWRPMSTATTAPHRIALAVPTLDRRTHRRRRHAVDGIGAGRPRWFVTAGGLQGRPAPEWTSNQRGAPGRTAPEVAP